jgi:hypothetical protein
MESRQQRGLMEKWTCPRERGLGKEINPQCRNPSKQTQWKSTSKAGQRVDCTADLSWTRGHMQILTVPPCWERCWPNSCRWRVTQLSVGEINSSDHPAWSVKATSPHNFNLTGRQKNNTVLTSQSLGETTAGFLLYASTRTGCWRSNSRT